MFGLLAGNVIQRNFHFKVASSRRPGRDLSAPPAAIKSRKSRRHRRHQRKSRMRLSYGLNCEKSHFGPYSEAPNATVIRTKQRKMPLWSVYRSAECGCHTDKNSRLAVIPAPEPGSFCASCCNQKSQIASPPSPSEKAPNAAVIRTKQRKKPLWSVFRSPERGCYTD